MRLIDVTLEKNIFWNIPERPFLPFVHKTIIIPFGE